MRADRAQDPERGARGLQGCRVRREGLRRRHLRRSEDERGSLDQGRDRRRLSHETRSRRGSKNTMKDATLIRTGAVGAVIAAVCCATPVLVIALGAVGLAASAAYLDYVLLPALAVCIG